MNNPIIGGAAVTPVRFSGAANAIKGKKSGEVVTLTDVSPLEHEMAVKASQGGATVHKYGKNLFDVNNWVEKSAATLAEDGSYHTNNLAMYNAYGRNEDSYLYKPENGNVPITISFTAKKESTEAYGSCFGITFVYTDGTTVNKAHYGKIVDGESVYDKIDFTSDKSKTLSCVKYLWCTYHAYVKDFQIEIGTTATEYEPYQGHETYTDINEDGTVNGVTSLYPSTTLLTDTEGVTIEAEYNVDTKKYIDNKFAELQALILEV